MNYLTIIVESSIFGLLSGLHFYWAAGGRKGLSSALPQKTNGEKLFVPGIGATLVVAFGLLGFCIITLANLGVFNFIISSQSVYWLNILIAMIFFLRAIGDFNYVGFFKKIQGTDFARWDTRLYSPLCLIISILSIINLGLWV
jgi:hypothetical protein